MRNFGTGLAGLVLSIASVSGDPLSAQPARSLRVDPVRLNIGLVCQWQRGCIAGQRQAMTKSLKFVAKYDPPRWRIHLCNRNASRGGQRVDWVGFDRCVRNEALRPPPPPAPPLKPVRKKRAQQ
ncbi:MAG: hypothetical protein ABIO29_06825 [Sphingomicrobium sp.]